MLVRNGEQTLLLIFGAGYYFYNNNNNIAFCPKQVGYYFYIELLQESPQAARVKVMASGNSVERRFRLDYYITCYSMHSKL
jgi:hypothetical protein